MKQVKKSIANKKGFTLIELLIVIGLLAALSALILPSLQADREEALGGICDYNHAGTVRTLKQFTAAMGHLPNDFHTGLQANDAAGATDPMGGIPGAQSPNLVDNEDTTNVALTAAQAESLAAAGVEDLCYGAGYAPEAVAAAVHVQRLTGAWVDDGGNSYSFDGIPATGTGTSGDPSTKTWEDEDFDGTADGIVVALWIAPTVDWSSRVDNANADWGNGNVSISVDLEGKCPIPAEALDGEVDFSYYMAYVKVYDVDFDGDGEIDPAKLIGTSCPECGVLNP